MDKKSAKYWALSEIVEELQGMLDNNPSSRGCPDIVWDEAEIMINKLKEKLHKKPLPKYDFHGGKEL